MPRPKGSHERFARPDNVRADAWQSMRILRRFTRPQLQTTAPKLKQGNAAEFIRCLVAAGYLRIVQDRANGHAGSYRVYQLVRDTGPLCPVCWNDGRVFDQNKKELFGSADA